MASFRDIWNLIVTGDTSDYEAKVKKMARTAEETGETVDTTFRGRMSSALGNFAQKIPGVSGLMEKFGVTSSQAGALLGTAVAGGAAAAGIAVERLLVASIDQFQQQAQEVLHFKEVTGLAADEASRFVAVADDFKVSAQDLSTEVGRLNKVAEASPGKLSELGIEIAKTKDGAYDAKQTFFNVVDAFNATDDASKRAAIGSAAFGKNWQSMVNLLEQGSGKLQESFAAVDDFQIFDDKDLENSEKYRHALDDLSDAVHGFERRLGEGLIPLITKAVDELTGIAEGADKVAKPLGGISGVFDKLGEGIGLTISGLRHLMDPIQMATDVTNGFKAAWHGIFGGGGDDTDKLAKPFEGARGAADLATEAILQSAAAVANHKYEMDQAAESAKMYIESNQGMRDALDDQREAAEKATQALKNYRDAAHDLLNEQLGLEGSFNTARDAIDDYNTKVLDHTTTVKDLRDANLDVRESWVSLGDQAVATAEQQAQLHGATLDAKGALDAQVTSLQELFKNLASDSPLRKALDEYILSLYNIPGEIHTNVDITGEDWNIFRGREGNAGGSAASGSAIVSSIKAYESSNGTSWRTGPQ